jgi:hypothetical protein
MSSCDKTLLISHNKLKQQNNVKLIPHEICYSSTFSHVLKIVVSNNCIVGDNMSNFKIQKLLFQIRG